MTHISERWKVSQPVLKEFEKWRAIRASVGGLGGMLAWLMG